jgi:hypothetical protein
MIISMNTEKTLAKNQSKYGLEKTSDVKEPSQHSKGFYEKALLALHSM